MARKHTPILIHSLCELKIDSGELLLKLGFVTSEVAYNDTRGLRQFKATRPERKEKKGVAFLP